MARKKSGKVGAAARRGGGAEAERGAERAARMAAFAALCERARGGAAWDPPGGEARRRYRQAGRPPVFGSLDEFHEGVLAYVEQCDRRVRQVAVNRRGEAPQVVGLPDPAPKSVADLCLFLGISRCTYYRFAAEGHPFAPVCERFDLVSESSWYGLLEDPKRMKAAQLVLQSKQEHLLRQEVESDRQALGLELAELLAELDGKGFSLPGAGATDRDNKAGPAI